MTKLMDELKKKNLPIALLSDHSLSKYSSGPKFYRDNEFTVMSIKDFLNKSDNPNDPFYFLAIKQKNLKENSRYQVYTYQSN